MLSNVFDMELAQATQEFYFIFSFAPNKQQQQHLKRYEYSTRRVVKMLGKIK